MLSVVSFLRFTSSEATSLTECNTWDDDEVGRRVADSRFAEVASAAGFSAEDIEAATDDGYLELPDGQVILITHSTPVVEPV